MEDDTPIDEALFELEVRLCERFSGLSPLGLRHELAANVFRLVSQLIDFSRRENKKKKNGNEVIRVKAPDTWF